MKTERDVARQDGIAKATLELMVQNPRNDMDAARLGLVPIVPEGTTFDLDISAGHARVDMSAQALNAEDKQQEENMRIFSAKYTAKSRQSQSASLSKL